MPLPQEQTPKGQAPKEQAASSAGLPEPAKQ
jgi:hypothetical protein